MAQAVNSASAPAADPRQHTIMMDAITPAAANGATHAAVADGTTILGHTFHDHDIITVLLVWGLAHAIHEARRWHAGAIGILLGMYLVWRGFYPL